MPNPHFDISIVQRSKGKSAVAGAAYQSGEKLFSEYDQTYKDYRNKHGIVYTEILLPPNAPPEYADRATLWNAAEEVEKQWNSQLARRFVLALPREIPSELYPKMVRDYCEEHFQAFLIMVCVAIYSVLVQNISVSTDISTAIWTCMGYTVLLCFCLFKTSSLARSVFNAH